MKKILLLTSAIALSIATMAQVANQPKWDFTLERMMLAETTTRSASSELTPVTVEVTDAEVVMNFIQEAGFTATFITDNTITAVIPVDFVPSLAKLNEVVHITGPRQMETTMELAREMGGVEAIHTNASNEFETPFTGKGVIVGVIDVGFEYRHPAFLDKEGKSRVVALWNRAEGGNATTTIPIGGQVDESGGHGTHVAGIAVGSKITGSSYHGVAPEADLIMIPSNLNDAEVLEDVAYIKNFAKKQRKPYVINMSFGAHTGGHDGMSLYNRTLNQLVTDNSGVFVCAAGNDGNDKLHASHTFTADNEVRYVMIDQSTSARDYALLQIWDQTADGRKHITVETCYFDKNSGQVIPFNNSTSTVYEGIDSYSKKHNFEVISYYSDLQKAVGKTNISFGVKITGEKGATVHVWNNSNLGYIYNPAPLEKNKYLEGDNSYLVSDSGASAEKSITVASYNTGRYSWKSLAGSNVRYPEAKQGVISAFSGRGPVLTPGAMKPTIAAPGSYLISSYNKFSKSFKTTNANVISSVVHNGETFYYGAMQGTSMAAPFVTGVIALWYQANPNLTYNQILTIIEETAITDKPTKTAGKDGCGFGKIDAYEGLKAALKLAATDGINDMQNSEAPVSFYKGNNAWRVLFNNNESYATIRVTDLNGRLVAQQTVEQPKRGEETVVSLSNCPAGVYLINVTTTKANITRKVMKN